jgi:primosomal protein N'
MSSELGLLLTPPPEKLKIMGPAEAPVPRLKNEYRYQFLMKAASRKALNELLQRIQRLRARAQVGRDGAGDRRRPVDADVGLVRR